MMMVIVLVLGILLLILMLPPTPRPTFETQQSIDVDGWKIHYRAIGSGPALVLVHGIGASLHAWHLLEPLLANHFQVISLDLPGFGSSSMRMPAQYGLDEQAGHIVRFMDQLNIRQCILVGHSMGGNIALWVSKKFPGRVSKLVVIAPAAHPKLAMLLARHLTWLAAPAAWLFSKPIASFLHKATRGRPHEFLSARVQQTLSTYRKNPMAIRTFLAATAAICDPRIGSETFDKPTLVLWGKKDHFVPRWVIDRLMPRLKKAKLVVLNDGGHELFGDDPQWTFEQMRVFLGI